MRGLWTALITPFKDGDGINNEVDYDALERLLHMQIEGGVTGVLLLGTTGERPTLTEQEEQNIINFSIGILRGKTKIMVNAGTYSTMDTLKTISYLDKIADIDAYLVVNPYYNKPTQTGLYKHFSAAAQATSRDIFLYNIQGRTGVNLQTDTLVQLVESHDNIIGVKEASGSLEQMKEVIQKTPDEFLVLSGDDGMTYDLVQAGGDGVVSVASNAEPKAMNDFVQACLSGDESAQPLNERYQGFFSDLFIQSNPLPLKTYLSEKGIICEAFRLPMCPMDAAERKQFLESVNKYIF